MTLRAAYHLANFSKVMDQEGLWMKPEAVQNATASGKAFLQSFLWLAKNAFEQGLLLYKLRPKLHLFHHWIEGDCCLSNIPFNPKAYSCWSDEDFVRRVCAVAQACGHLGIVKSMMTRYLAGAIKTWMEFDSPA